eukprot:TRINITY_DN9401_c0_g1_i1.p1 TRINITY_DN9401_c0_g1~~TRINITY_DN9401_c0_g1_i1.p1  ORF type:complete len:591 (-),score=124.18 TRINITY_DN9401_c0_g1_i1:266-1831(-)
MEIKALRRIIDAYLNYAEAAEVDVRKWERSYSKLQQRHKALLEHLPEKYQHLRRCIAVNSFFIFNMLQAFEPPFDMSQDVDIENEQLGIPNENEQNAQHIDVQLVKLSSLPDSVDTQDLSLELSVEGNPTRKQNATSLIETDKAATGLACRNGIPVAGTRSEQNDRDGSYESAQCSISSTERAGQSCFANELENLNSRSVCCSRQTELGFCERAKVVENHFSCHPADMKKKENCMSVDTKDHVFQLHVSPADIDKVRCIIRNIVRDWASEGLTERKQCYEPILEELKRYFPNRSRKSPPTCLVPGAGLGRLALEISRLGFVSQGNEFSYYMMICSNFILNHTHKAREWVIYPWIHSNCNSLSDEDQLRPVHFPDLHPGSAGITEGFSMCAGDFVEVYNDPSQFGTWDAVVTCFFIDTAHNVVEYIEIISKILKAGGIWINLGPLLYHFADTYAPEDEMSIELSLEDVKKIAFHYGFGLEAERTVETTYTANPASMMQNKYFAAFWTMKKKASSERNGETPL